MALQSNLGEGRKSGLVESAASSFMLSMTSGACFFLDFWTVSHSVFKPEASELQEVSCQVTSSDGQIRK